MLDTLGIDDISEVADAVWWHMKQGDGEEDLAGKLKKLLSDIRRKVIIEDVLRDRALAIFEQVRPHVKEGSVLDWGCGDAFVAECFGGAPTLLDIADHRRTLRKEPLLLWDGTSEEFSPLVDCETVLLLTVLHHARFPGLTLQKACSVGQRVVVIESTPELRHPVLEDVDELMAWRVRYEYCGFVDWFYNRVICDDVLVSFNYLHARGWMELFAANGFRLADYEELGLDHAIVPEWHALLVFERPEVFRPPGSAGSTPH